MAKEEKNKAGRRPPCFVLWDEDKMKKMKTVSYSAYIIGKLFQKKPGFCYKNVNSYVNSKSA